MEPLIIDVRENASGNSSPSSPVVDAIIGGLSKPSGARSLPTLLLYNERGLRLYDDITTKAPEYYLFGCEEQILAEHGDDIVKAMKAAQRDDEVVIELGAGALRKTSHFLRALARAAKPVDHGERPKTSYFALDLERRELVRTLDELSTSIGDELAGRVAFGGMWGTYDGGIAFVKRGGLKELHFNQKIANRLDEPDTQRGRPAVHTPIVRTAQPTPTPSESDRASPPQDDGLAAPGLTIATGSTAQTPNRSALPTPPSSLPSPTSEDLEATPIQLLFLGSSIGNFTPDGAADFLRSLPLRAGSGDTLLLGLDQKNDADLIRLAYDDPQGYTRAFALNGLKNAAEVTGGSIDDNQWSYVEKYNATLGRHEGYYRSKSNQTVRLPTSDAHPAEETVELQEGELVNFEYSYKYSEKDALALFDAARLRVMRRWQDKQGLYSLWLLERAPFSFPVPTLTRALDIPTTVDGEVPGTSQKPVTPFPSIPTRGEWAEMWKAWDAITLGMIPREMLHQKPIDLRHKCLFYLGHIPAFLDIHLTRLLAGKHTEPEYFKDIFERGIDPHVDDPTQIHPHSEVPVNDEDWPSLEEILGFRDRVRKRLMNLYDDFESGEKPLTRKAGRVIWMTFEHEASHAETLLYMLIQRAGSGTIPPPTTVPDWEALAKVWDAEVSATAAAPKVVRIGPAEVRVGHDDFENQDTSAPEGWQSSYEFGWDNEHPRRTISIGSVDVSTSPITNRDYFDFLSKQSRLGENDIPASWVRLDDKIHVRTLYGPVPYDVAKHWPLAASYDEISAYARAQNGRLPTEPELLAFRDQCDSTVKGEGNIGYRSWHYVPPRPSTREARGHNGGIWEWASTLMHAHDGFVPSSLYPGYSADFHDEQHHVVLGGSFVTIPRIAMRRSYVNFYQHNYPYAWIGGRTCHLGGYFVPPGSVSERALKFEPRIYLPREAYTKLQLRKVVPRHVTKTGFLDDLEILMSWTDVVLSVVFVFSAVYILKLSDGLRLPATWRLKILQDSRLSAVSLPPRPSFGHRKHAPAVSRTSYAATAFTRDRALRSFSRYEALARNELGAKRRNLNNLRGRHARIAAEIGYEGKLDQFRAAIDINNKVAGATVRCSMLQDENASAVLQSWTDDGPTDLSRVTEALKHCIRDWSLSGQEERTRVFRPILDVLNQVPIDQRKSTKVLVPGAGLCRLGWEIARMGFDVTANEVSSYMTLPFQMLLDIGATPVPNCHTVCPHFSWFSHTRSNDNLFQTATFPDIVPRVGPDGTISSSLEAEKVLGEELGDFYAPGGKFQLVDSDFLSLSSPNRTNPASHSVDIETSHLPLVPIQPHDRGYDFIVTLFFIDTAHNILAYLDQIHALLRGQRERSTAGTWINLGPLLWPTGASLEASLEEVLAMSRRVGLDVVGETESDQAINSIETRRTLECQYTANRAGMMKWMYQAEFWVARRRED